MRGNNKLYSLLRLRRRIDRKILLNQKWPSQYSVRNRIEVLRHTKSVFSLWAKEENIYSLLNKKIEKYARKNNLITPYSTFQIESVNKCKLVPEWFQTLKEYGKQLDSLGAKLIVQGSYADSEITNYSDVDLVIFYKPFNSEVLKIKKEIETFLLTVDPLQHHGVFMIDIGTLSFYWQMDLPVEVLKKAKYFGDLDSTLPVTGVLSENTGSLKAAENVMNVIKKFLNKDYRQIGLWEWKFFISDVLLFPTLLLGSKGKYIYKRDSFPLAKEMFSKDAWYCIEKATTIRSLWPDAKTLKKYKNVRTSVSEKPVDDLIKVVDVAPVSVENDSKFTDSLRLLIKESEIIISNG